VTAFEDIVSSFNDSNLLYAAVQEASAELLRERREGVTPEEIGHRAWRTLTPLQQAQALDSLFHVYVMQVHHEETEKQLDRTSETVDTYIEGDEEHDLWTALKDVPRPIEDTVTVDGVPAYALGNVLSELALIRRRRP
jgi:hypothetical protein